MTMTDELPLNPEQWLQVVNDAVQASGHGDEVLVAVEVTMDAWKVTVNPVVTPAPPAGPVPE
jgi:hypothetical protein